MKFFNALFPGVDWSFSIPDVLEVEGVFLIPCFFGGKWSILNPLSPGGRGLGEGDL